MGSDNGKSLIFKYHKQAKGTKDWHMKCLIPCGFYYLNFLYEQASMMILMKAPPQLQTPGASTIEFLCCKNGIRR